MTGVGGGYVRVLGKPYSLWDLNLIAMTTWRNDFPYRSSKGKQSEFRLNS